MIAKERKRLSAQVVIATHSSVLINPELCRRVGATTLVVARGRCEVLSDSRRILDDLGVTSGDLIQANGVVWVEGQSDRIYISVWLERLARALGELPPIEGVHYVMVAYGGSVLKHLTLAQAKPGKLALREVNRNLVVVIDLDLPTNDRSLTAEKARLLAEAAELAPEPNVWITQGYTIESYLSAHWLPATQFVHIDEAGRTRVRGIAKVTLAERFREDKRPWLESFALDSDLPERITMLYRRIMAWQTPQEEIVPPYLPPFLTPLADDQLMSKRPTRKELSGFSR